MQFISRAYNNFELDSSGAVVIKKSKESRLADEIDYYTNLPEKLSIYFPRIVYSKYDQSIYEVGMEHYAYDNLGNLMINQPFDNQTWVKVFNFLFKFINHSQKHTTDKKGKVDCHEMYIDKTEREYNNLLDRFSFFEALEKNTHIVLNGKELRTFRMMWAELKDYIQSSCLVDELNYIHGDFCFSNILYGVNPITNNVVLKYIDPRGSFGNIKYYGDSYYDLAKLLHSCDGGYEYFITDNFKVSNQDMSFDLSFTNDNRLLINDIFGKILQEYGFNQTKIKLLQGTIFIGMCARHYDSFERQKGMFLTGLRILNEIYETI